MTTAETLHSTFIHDSARTDTCRVQAKLVTDFDLLTYEPYRYVVLSSDNGNCFSVHECDLTSFIRIVRDVTLYALHMEPNDEPYFSHDFQSYIEGYTHIDEGVTRVIFNHFHEFDGERTNFVTLTKDSAKELLFFLEQAMDMMFIQDIQGS